jgi:hypothetical protein
LKGISGRRFMKGEDQNEDLFLEKCRPTPHCRREATWAASVSEMFKWMWNSVFKCLINCFMRRQVQNFATQFFSRWKPHCSMNHSYVEVTSQWWTWWLRVRWNSCTNLNIIRLSRYSYLWWCCFRFKLICFYFKLIFLDDFKLF